MQTDEVNILREELKNLVVTKEILDQQLLEETKKVIFKLYVLIVKHDAVEGLYYKFCYRVEVYIKV